MKGIILAAMALAAVPVKAQEAGAVFAAPLAALQTAVRASNAKSALAIVSDRTTTVSVPLNAATVKCSRADYAEPLVKVLIPALAELTVLNHRNTREGAPCVSAGACRQMSPQDILRGGEGVDQVKIRVVLRKETAIEGEVCRVTLIETVTTTIRGVSFSHDRTQEVAERTAADCR